MPVPSVRPGLPILMALSLLGGLLACVPLPVRVAPAASGMVRDAVSGRPIEGAIVVVRFDGRYDEVLPEALPIGHRETVTDASGRFVAPGRVTPGFAAWPWLSVEGRVVAVWREGYRCPAASVAIGAEPAQVALAPAEGPAEARNSCRPVDAPEHQVPRYSAAWRSLHQHGAMAARLPEAQVEPELDRTLDARRLLGFGANCRGPVLDLALAPGGHRAAILVQETHGNVVRLVEPVDGTPRRARELARPIGGGLGPLRWTGPGELAAASAQAPDAVTRLDDPIDILWRESLPAAAAPAADAMPSPESLHSDTSAWGGRSFETRKDLDPATGLPRDRLHVSSADGSSHVVDLPGEACRGARSFGNPHYRIAAGGRHALDIRTVGTGCHAVAIDLETGGWSRLVSPAPEDGPAVCRDTRRVPRTQLEQAMRGYLHQLDARVVAAGADPASAFAIVIEDEGDALVEVVDLGGSLRVVPAPPFPIETPLRRIEVSTVSAPAGSGGLPAVETAPPLSELDPL